MQTEKLDARDPATAGESVRRAAALLRAGELVIIPTETVYGLAADALNPAAVARIFTAKGRPQDNPLIVHISELAELPPLVEKLPELAIRLARAFWPGPLTMVLPKSGRIPLITSGGLETVGIRMPSQETARAILRETGRPLAAPSANTSGSPSPTTAARCAEDMDGRVAAIVDGGPCCVGVESTVVSVTGPVPVVLRPGAVTPEMIAQIAGDCRVDPSVLAQLSPGQRAASPGMKYKHYSPRAKVVILRGEGESYCQYVNASEADGVFALCFDEDLPRLHRPCLSYGARGDDGEQARRLFDALRELDDRGAKLVYAREPHAGGVGLAVYNRLLRAAGFDVRDL